MLNIVCVQTGNYLGRGVEYTNKLYKGLQRNTSKLFKMWVLTDRIQEDYHPAIGFLDVPKDVKGWYAKLYLFKEGLFPAGERVVFLDLDTVITGNIDQLLNYKGDFAILSDFLTPTRYGPGVMAWRAGIWPRIWTSWVAAGKPHDLDLGDLTWINRLFCEAAFKPDILQDVVNGVYSYKVHCRKGLPADASIVCFHGLPRPHEVTAPWMGEHWDGGTSKNS